MLVLLTQLRIDYLQVIDLFVELDNVEVVLLKFYLWGGQFLYVVLVDLVQLPELLLVELNLGGCGSIFLF